MMQSNGIILAVVFSFAIIIGSIILPTYFKIRENPESGGEILANFTKEQTEKEVKEKVNIWIMINRLPQGLKVLAILLIVALIYLYKR